RRLSEAFYARVAQDPVLRPFFPGKTFRCAIEAFAAFLVQFLGGPPEDAQRRWWLSLRESHFRFKIGPKERDAWMKNMVEALKDSAIEEPAHSALLALFERSSAYVVNNGNAPATADGEKTPSSGIHQEIGRRWDAQRTLDETVAAVRRGSAEDAIVMVEGPVLRTYVNGNRSVLAALVALMIGRGDGALLSYAEARLL